MLWHFCSVSVAFCGISDHKRSVCGKIVVFCGILCCVFPTAICELKRYKNDTLLPQKPHICHKRYTNATQTLKMTQETLLKTLQEMPQKRHKNATENATGVLYISMIFTHIYILSTG